jgi:protein TonB
MSYAHAALPPPRIDAKRIAATSGAIAVHVAILMMLMMPPEVTEPVAREEVIVPNWEKPKELPRITPPPREPRPQVVRQAPVATPVRVPDPPVEPVDSTPSVVDYVAPPPSDPPTSFDAGTAASEFQQLAVANGPPPTYPKMAVTRGIQGTVMLRIHVDAAGRPLEVSIEKSSGSRLLDEAALKFVQARWTFVPAQSGGQAVDAWGLVPIEFVLQ